MTITWKMPPPDPFSDKRADEWRLCTCGLVAVGYRASWAIEHVDKCPAAALFRDPPAGSQP